jgi:hypothetical protein
VGQLAEQRLFGPLAFHGWTDIAKASGNWMDGKAVFTLYWTCGCVAEREGHHNRLREWKPVHRCVEHRA